MVAGPRSNLPPATGRIEPPGWTEAVAPSGVVQAQAVVPVLRMSRPPSAAAEILPWHPAGTPPNRALKSIAWFAARA